MGKAFRCDLCRRLFEGEPTKEVDVPLVPQQLQMVASLRVTWAPVTTNLSAAADYDLCPNCVMRLREALHKAFDSAFPNVEVDKIEDFLKFRKEQEEL